MKILALLLSLLLAQPANAVAVLGFGVCNSQGSQLSPVGAGTWFNPFTSVGLNDWSFGQPASGPVGSPIYLQIQLIDTAPYTFTDDAPLATWSVQLAWSGAVSISPDSDPQDGLAFNVTVNNGSGHANENLAALNGNVVGNSFGIGNLFLSGWSNLPDDPTTRYYALANVRVDVWGPGTITMTDPNEFIDSWVDMNGLPGYDAAIFAGVPVLHVVPEPPALILLVTCGVLRRRGLP